MSDKLGRFGHHPDPVIDLEVEVTNIEGEIINHKVGYTIDLPALKRRAWDALNFNASTPEAIRIKNYLRTLLPEVSKNPMPEGRWQFEV